MTVAVLVMFNMTISNSLVKWQAIKTNFYIAHQIAAPPVSCEKGVVEAGYLDFLDNNEFHKLSVFAILYDVESKTVVETKDQSGFVLALFEERALKILDAAAGGDSEKIKLPKGGVGKFDDVIPTVDRPEDLTHPLLIAHHMLFASYHDPVYIYTLPVAIGCNENSRDLGFLMVGAAMKKSPSETLEKVFCRMVELTGAQIDVYGEECGLTEGSIGGPEANI